MEAALLENIPGTLSSADLLESLALVGIKESIQGTRVGERMCRIFRGSHQQQRQGLILERGLSSAEIPEPLARCCRATKGQ